MSRRTETPFWQPDAVQALLPTRIVGKNLVVFNRITSTNDFLKRIARRGAATGTVVLADEQTAGRGRMQRPWQSPPGKGLWFSVLLRPQLTPEKIGIVSLAIAAAAAEAFAKICGEGFHVKWPNDVLFQGKKVCGILCETQIVQDEIEAVIAGVGVNVSQTEHEFAPALRPRAISLAQACGKFVDRQHLLIELLALLERDLFGNLRSKLALLKAAWCSRCYDLGQHLTVTLGTKEKLKRMTTGVFEGIGDGGELILRLSNGTLQFFSAGEITLAREAT